MEPHSVPQSDAHAPLAHANAVDLDGERPEPLTNKPRETAAGELHESAAHSAHTPSLNPVPNPNPALGNHAGSWGAAPATGIPSHFPSQAPFHGPPLTKGDDALAFDLEAGRRPGLNDGYSGGFNNGLNGGFQEGVKRSTRHERWLERQAQKQGPWGEGFQGIHVLLWLIPVSGGLGYAFVLPWIHPWALRLTLYITVGVCLCLALVCLYLVNQLDPGVVTPQPMKDPEVVAAESGQPSRLCMDGRAQWVRPPPCYTGPMGVGTQIRGWERYCSTCNIWRGPRVTHCSVCGYCMLRFDHHCAVVGTCIAQNNHRFFVVFLMSSGVGAALLFAASIILLVQRHWEGSHAWSDWHTYLGLLMTFYYFYLAFLLLFGCCHLCLLLCDLTSKQMAQRRINEAFGGFCSCLRNLVRVCCAPIRHKRDVIPPYNIGQPPPARINRAGHQAPAGRDLEPGKSPEGSPGETGWKDIEQGVLRNGGAVGERNRETAGLDGSDDHVVSEGVAVGVDPGMRARAEGDFQEEENRRVGEVAHLGPLFPGM